MTLATQLIDIIHLLEQDGINSKKLAKERLKEIVKELPNSDEEVGEHESATP